MNDEYLDLLAAARRERFTQEADEWRLYRSLDRNSSRWHEFRRFAGETLIRMGGVVGEIGVDDRSPVHRQAAQS